MHRLTLRDHCVLSLSKGEQSPSTRSGCIVIQCNDSFVYLNKTLCFFRISLLRSLCLLWWAICERVERPGARLSGMRGAASIGSYLILIITVDMYASKKLLHHTCCRFLEKYVRVHSPYPFSIAVIVFSSYAVGLSM